MNELVDKQADAGLRELALFAGAGGGILGGHLLGWRTICAVEWEPYPASVLISRQNDGILPPFPIWDDVQTFDGKPWRGRVDIISGGFPCQDISCAGKGAGIDGERSSMWAHMARIIGEVRPQRVFVENSPMLVGRGLARVLGDLAEMGYDAKWCVLGAVDAGAPHKRDRIWLIAADSRRERAGAMQDIRSKGVESVREDATNVSIVRSTRGELADPNELTSEIGRDDNADAGEGGRRCFKSGRGGTDDFGKPRTCEAGEMGDTNNNGPHPSEIGESITEGSNGSSTRAKQARKPKRSGEQHEELADTDSERGRSRNSRGENAMDADSSGKERVQNSKRIPSSENSTNTNGHGCDQGRGCISATGGDRLVGSTWWATEPDVGRMVDELAGKLDITRKTKS